MPDTTSGPTPEQIVDAVNYLPLTAVSDGSIFGLLTKRRVETTRDEVRNVCDDLVDEGRLEVVAQKGRSKRYRVVGGE